MTLPQTTEIASSSSCGVAFFLPPQQIPKAGQHLPYSNSLRSSVFNRNYHFMTFIYLLTHSPTRRVSPTSRYVFGVIIGHYHSPLMFSKGSIPRVSPDAQDVAPLTSLETRWEGPRPEWCCRYCSWRTCSVVSCLPLSGNQSTR